MSRPDDVVVFEADTSHGQYQVVDTVYEGRPARVLFSGDHMAAQSGIPCDDKPDLLFDYNQRLFELSVELAPKTILVIGGGAYTLPMALRKVLPQAYVEVVELDDQLEAIAKNYFGLEESKHLKIIHAEGRTFLEQNTKQYDLVIVDAFMHVQIPRTLLTRQAAARLAAAVRPGGTVAANVIAAYYGRRISPLVRIAAAYQTAFTQLTLYPANPAYSLWTTQNFILVGQVAAGEPPELRFEALMLPRLDNSDVLEDEQL